MKGTSILAGLTAVLVFSLLGCGGPAVGNLKTVTLSAAPSTNLVGEGGTVQLSVFANYNTGATKPIANGMTFTVTPTGTDDTGAALLTPPNTITVNSTGMITAVAPFVCSWVDTTPTNTTATWFLSGSYQIVATFKGVASQPVFVSLASAASSTNPAGKCGP